MSHRNAYLPDLLQAWGFGRGKRVQHGSRVVDLFHGPRGGGNVHVRHASQKQHRTNAIHGRRSEEGAQRPKGRKRESHAAKQVADVGQL